MGEGGQDGQRKELRVWVPEVTKHEAEWGS